MSGSLLPTKVSLSSGPTIFTSVKKVECWDSRVCSGGSMVESVRVGVFSSVFKEDGK